MGFVAVFVAILFPVAVGFVWLNSLTNEKYRHALYKLHLFREGFAHLLLSTDKKFPKKQPSPSKVNVTETKRVVFVRHGESAWNVVFNKGFNSTFPTRLGSAIAAEAEMFASENSIFVDAPLSVEGTVQAKELASYLENDLAPEKVGKSILCSSNLRRALSTGTIGFWERLNQTKEKIHILSSLQEVTFNIDGMSLAKPYSSPELGLAELRALGFSSPSKFQSEIYFNCSDNKGNKPVRSSGFDRLVEFAEWCFVDKQKDFDTVIASGHSLYFRYFFKTFLDAPDNHVAKVRKMRNCSVVSFDLQKGTTPDGNSWFKIPEDSIEELYLGFEGVSLKKVN